MYKRVADQVQIRRPRRRVISDRPDKGSFFPGEVARMLDIEDMDNQRLRRIFTLVRKQRDAPLPPSGEWARFDYIDIACTVEVVRICVDNDRLSRGDFRLALVHISRACERLRLLGLENPLLQARLDLSGKRVVATIGGTTFDVQTGQQLIDQVVIRSSTFMAQFHREGASADLLQRIEQERQIILRQSRGQMTTRFTP